MQTTISILLLLAAGPAPDDAKLTEAVRHRCILECVWAKDHKFSGGKGDAFMNACGEACMDPKAIQAAIEAEIPAGWGTTKKDAIEVCLPAGEQYFLRDLRCPGGERPTFERSGSVGPRNPIPEGTPFDMKMMDPTHRLAPGEVDHHTIDRYEVSCPGKTHTLYLDMYHCGTPKPWKAPKGFTRPLR